MISARVGKNSVKSRRKAVPAGKSDAEERERAEKTLRLIVQGTSPVTGIHFFSSLVRYLARALQVRYAFVAEVTDEQEGTARTLAFWDGDDFGLNFTFRFKGTPCEAAARLGIAFYRERVAEIFPRTEWLGRLKAESYLAVPFYNTSGECIGFLAVLHDRPLVQESMAGSILKIFAARAGAELERKWAEENTRKLNGELERRVQERTVELEESRELFRTLATAAPVGIYQTNAEGHCVYVNERWCEISGLTQEEARGEGWKRAIHPEDRDRVLAEWEKSVESNLPFRSEYRVLRSNGEESLVFVQGAPEKCEKGRCLGYVGTVTDITERKNLEMQLHQAQKMEAVGRLAGGVAHDFNNLLMVIKGYSELPLSRMAADDPVRVNLEEILKATERANSMTQQLLAFSRKAVFEQKVVDLNKVMSDMEYMLQRLIGEQIELVMVSSAKLGTVKADPSKIEQVIMNLAVNARDAMPGGGKLILETANIDLDETYLRRHNGVTGGPYVMLAVSDTGLGMDADTRNRIFEPFFTTKERGRGTGLGLSTVYGIVQQSNGYIWVYSEPGQGTSFKIYLPWVPDVASAPRNRTESVGRRNGCETVLVVEDEEPVRTLARTFLEQSGYRVVDASNGEKALRFGERFSGPIHVLITDVVMPGMNGLELAERHLALHPESKVLYMSGYTDDSMLRKNGISQDAPFLQKPFSMDLLIRRLRELLDGDQDSERKS